MLFGIAVWYDENYQRNSHDGLHSVALMIPLELCLTILASTLHVRFRGVLASSASRVQVPSPETYFRQK